MADLPPIAMDYTAAGAPVVIVAEAQATDLAEAVRLAPALADPQWLGAYVQVANHLAKGDRFEPIFEPEEFKAEYMAAYDAEDPSEEPIPGNTRLHNYGVPDFSVIAAPVMEGDRITFYARNTFMGIPYKVTMVRGGVPTYEPVAMTP